MSLGAEEETKRETYKEKLQEQQSSGETIG